MKKNYILLAILFLTCQASAQKIRAVFYNPPGADNGQEYVEIEHTATTALTGLTFIVMEGDGSNAGTIDKAIDISTYSTGSNGLLLWRDAATVLTPAPSAATSLVVNDFNPDIENGTNTYLLVSGYTGSINTDYDVNNDGVLDSTPWASVVSAVSVTDGATGDYMYAASLGGVNLPNTSGTPHGFVLSNSVYYAVTVTGSGPGPYNINNAWDSSGSGNAPVASTILHPGNTSSPLPILLEKFTGNFVNEAVELNWTTSQETNNVGFTIEHSTKGLDFSSLDFVQSKAKNGTSETAQDYSYRHSNFSQGKNYYRLVQQDINGKEIVSEVINVYTGKTPLLEIIGIYPNPTFHTLNMEMYSPNNTKVEVAIINLAGQEVDKVILSIETGVSNHALNVSRLPLGSYILVLRGANTDNTSTLFIKK